MSILLLFIILSCFANLILFLLVLLTGKKKPNVCTSVLSQRTDAFTVVTFMSYCEIELLGLVLNTKACNVNVDIRLWFLCLGKGETSDF